MLNREASMEIQILYKQGKSLKQIAKETGYSINTVRKYARDHKEPEYRTRETKPQKLDGYRDYIQARVKQAYPNWLAATVIYREIKNLGYKGSLSLLTAYLRTLKPVIKETPIVRYETAPGWQMQVDFASFNYEGVKFCAFVAVLGYSRAMYAKFVLNQQLATLLDCHKEAFHYFGGVPLEILYDNMKTVIIQRNAYGTGHHRLQAGFLDFAKHYGFVPRVCRPYRPQTKGKVERSIGYLRTSFYLPWVTQQSKEQPFDLEQLNYAAGCWLDRVANCRQHQTLLAKPQELLKEERASLQSIPYDYVVFSEPSNKPHAQNRTTHGSISLQHNLAMYDALLTGRL